MSTSAIRIALASKAAAPEVHPKETSWEQLCKKLMTVEVGPKDGPGWLPVEIDLGPRRNDRVRSVSALVLDVETKNGVIPPSPDWLQATLEVLGFDSICHTSHSHSPENPRYRVVIRLAEPMPPTMLKQALAAIAHKMGLADCWDRQCTDASRLFYRPRCPEASVHLFRAFTVKGRALPLLELQGMIGQISNANVLPFPTLAVDDRTSTVPETPETVERVKNQLAAISADCDRRTWRDIVWAVISTGWESAYSLAREWSQTAPDLFDQREFDKVVNSFRPDGGITLGTLQHYAKAAGWTGDPLLVSANKPRFTFRSLDELRNQPPLQWRVKGLLPQTGLAAIIGQSGSGKTFLALHLLARIALGEEFFGFKTESCPVVYLGLEGGAGIGKRIRAYEQHYNQQLPENFRVVTDRLSLLSTDAAEFAKAVAEEGLQGGVVVIDTMAQASPGADENASGDMGRIVFNAQLLQVLSGSLIILVHHIGKDAARGARGHSSLTAALDTVIEVKLATTCREWGIAKSKDGEDGIKRSFRLEQVQLGTDADGDLITSCVAVPDTSALFSKPKLTGKNQGPVWAAISAKHSTGQEVTRAELQKLAGEAITITSNKSQRIKETIGALTEKGYLTLTDSQEYLIN